MRSPPHFASQLAALAALGAVVAAGAPSCQDFPSITRNTCGNSIIEAGESCDGAAVGANTCSPTCRLLCADTGPKCPVGYGCGKDAVCRAPKGEFRSLTTAHVDADDVALGDLDRDGAIDLLTWTAQGFTIAYLDGARITPDADGIRFGSTIVGGLTPTFSLTANVDPEAPSMSIFAASGRGVAAYDVRGDRSLIARAYPFRFKNALPDGPLLLFSADVDPRPESPGDELLAYSASGSGALYVINPADGAAIELYTLKAAALSWGKLVGDAGGSPGDDIVFAPKDGASVLVFEPLATNGSGALDWNTNGQLQAPTKIDLPQGLRVDGAAMPRHVVLGGSTPEDLLIPTATMDGKAHPLVVAFNRDVRQFYPTPTGAGALGKSARFHATEGPSETTAAVLEAGFINGDDLIDLVDEQGILLSHCSGPCALAYDPNVPQNGVTAAYVRSVTEALRGEARVVSRGIEPDAPPGDVVAYGSGKQLKLFKYVGAQLMNPIAIDTSSEAPKLSIGDFNGDGVTDVGLLKATTPMPMDGYRLEVSFSDALGLPSGLVELGRLDPGSTTFTGRLNWLAQATDNLSDIVAYAPNSPSSSMQLFQGSTYSRMVSPFFLGAACDGGPITLPSYVSTVKTNVAAGATTDDPAASLLAVTTVRPDTRDVELWLMRPDASSGNAACDALVGPTLVPGVASLAGPLAGPVARTADVDGDGIAEVLILAPATPSLTVARLSADEKSFTLGDVALGESWYARVSLLTVGTKADARPDVVLAANDAMSDTAVKVLWNEDGTSGIDPGRATAIPGELLRDCVPPDEKPSDSMMMPPPRFAIRAVAGLNLDADADPELAIGVDSTIVFIDVPGGFRAGGGPPRCLKLPLNGPMSGLAAGDVDGDGVDDLVVARGPAIEVFTGVAEVP